MGRFNGRVLLCFCFGCGTAAGWAQQPDDEPQAAGSLTLRRLELIDGGEFETPWFAEGEARLGTGLAFWRTEAGEVRQLAEAGAAHERFAALGPGARLSQPLAFGVEQASSLELAARVRGKGELRLVDAAGRTARWPFDIEDWSELAFDAEALQAALGAEPSPRCVLSLVADADAGAEFDGLRASVELAVPSADLLRASALEFIDATVDAWLARALDRDGPRETYFATRNFDAVTGGRLGDPGLGGVHPLFELLLELHALYGRQRDTAPLTRHLDDLLELGFGPDRAFPLLWDPTSDRPYAAGSYEIARCLRFLVDAAERGPLSHRERCRDAACGLAEFLGAEAVLPTGEVAGVLLPGAGRMSGRLSSLRRLDVAAQLVRASRLCERADWAATARGALSEFEYLHVWGGNWVAIDPAFDDDYGHYGARSASMAAAAPDDEYFARLALSGARHLLPIWRDTLYHGGFVAADQVRGWGVLERVAELEPARAAEIGELVGWAVRGHWKGEQDSAGAWVDVSHHRWDPKLKLEVGDVPGAPANLIEGLGVALEPALGLDPEELRGRLWTVLTTTRRAYGREFGLLPTRPESTGSNPESGSLRVALALVETLRRL